MKKSWKITIIIVLLFLIGREFLPFSISFYKDYSKTESSASSIYESSSRSWKENGLIVKDSSIRFDKKQLPKIVFYGFNKEKEYLMDSLKNGKNSIKVFVKNDLNIGLARYIPLIKPIDFSSKMKYSWDYSIKENHSITTVKGSGSIDTSGSKNIYGICSAKQAKKLIEQKIIDDAKKTVIADVNNKVKSISL